MNRQDLKDYLDASVAKMQLSPGDVIVITCQRVLTREQRDAMSMACQEVVSHLGAKVIVLDGGLGIVALTQADGQ